MPNAGGHDSAPSTRWKTHVAHSRRNRYQRPPEAKNFLAFRRPAHKRELGFLSVVSDDASRRRGRPAVEAVEFCNHVAYRLFGTRPRQPCGSPRMHQLFRRLWQRLPQPLVHGVSLAVRRCRWRLRPWRSADDGRADGPALWRTGLCSRLRSLWNARPVLRAGGHDHVVPFVAAGDGRAGHVQLIVQKTIRTCGRSFPGGPQAFAPPVMRRSCRPRIGQAARCVPAPDSSGSSPGGRWFFRGRSSPTASGDRRA